MTEAAVAYYKATGKTEFLDIMKKFADLICKTFGPDEGQIHGYPGHQEIELALIRLYHVTGEKKYLKQQSILLIPEAWEKIISWKKKRDLNINRYSRNLPDMIRDIHSHMSR